MRASSFLNLVGPERPTILFPFAEIQESPSFKEGKILIEVTRQTQGAKVTHPPSAGGASCTRHPCSCTPAGRHSRRWMEVEVGQLRT
jgi:hypothetical protein